MVSLQRNPCTRVIDQRVFAPKRKEQNMMFKERYLWPFAEELGHRKLTRRWRRRLSLNKLNVVSGIFQQLIVVQEDRNIWIRFTKIFVLKPQNLRRLLLSRVPRAQTLLLAGHPFWPVSTQCSSPLAGCWSCGEYQEMRRHKEGILVGYYIFSSLEAILQSPSLAQQWTRDKVSTHALTLSPPLN